MDNEEEYTGRPFSSFEHEIVYSLEYSGVTECGDFQICSAVGACAVDGPIDETVLETSAVQHFASQLGISTDTVDIISFTWSSISRIDTVGS